MRTNAAFAWVVAGALLCWAGMATAARIYQWTDEQGQMHYSDQPPPEDARSAEEKRVFSGTPDPSLPYTVRSVAANFPVTLYTAVECLELCERARTLLQERGIPFSEQVLVTDEDADAFRKIFGDPVKIPAITVGSRQIRGYAASSWNALLDRAGYPSEPLPAR